MNSIQVAIFEEKMSVSTNLLRSQMLYSGSEWKKKKKKKENIYIHI